MIVFKLKTFFQFAIFVLSVSYCSGTNKDDRFTSSFLDYYEIVEYKIRPLKDDEFPRSSVKRPYIHGFTFNITAFQRSFSIIVWPNNHIFQTNVRVAVISKGGEKSKRVEETLLYEGKLKDELGSRVSGYVVNGAFSGLITTKHKETLYVEPLFEHQESNNPLFTKAIIYKDTDINHNSTGYNCKVQPLRAKTNVPKRNHRQRKGTTHAKRVAKQYNSCPVLLAADSSFYKSVGNEAQALAKMSYHLSEADRLFRRTKFIETTGDIGLVIADMVIYQDKESEGIFSSPDDTSMEQYLRQWSKINHGNYCLSLLFTYRDFSNGVLGLAWLADLHNLGGICEDWNYHYKQSFNTAVVTFLNNGQLVPEKVATLTVTHELGHAFGAKHDPTRCQPNGDQGNYIMFEHATDTGHLNNDRFSECSIHDMRQVIEARAHCFTDGTSYCGNKIIESNEQCDCGNPDECENHDPCCMAKDKNGITGCLLKPDAQCSPKAGPCCSKNCQFMNNSNNVVCHQETECSFKSFCYNGTCLPANPKADNGTCNNGSNICQNGQCTGSICALYGLRECSCMDPNLSCHVCCENSKRECVSSADVIGRMVAQPVKKACDDYNGYCDGSGQCIKHAHEPRKIYNNGSFQEILDWIKKKWHIFILIGLGLSAQIFYTSYGKYKQRRARQQGGLVLHPLANENQAEII